MCSRILARLSVRRKGQGLFRNYEPVTVMVPLRDVGWAAMPTQRPETGVLQSRFDSMPRLPFTRSRREGPGSALDRSPFFSLLDLPLRQRVRKRLTRRRIAAGKGIGRE